MRKKVILVTFLTAVWFSNANAQTPIRENPAVSSHASDQTAVEVTAYNQNLALVKEVRKLNLPEGEGELRFMDVAAAVLPETVRVRSASGEDAFSVYEQNYEYDLLNEERLLDKYIGKNLKIVNWNEYQDRKEIEEATLLSNNGSPIFRIDGQIYLGHPGYKVLPEIPDNLIARPTLTWLYANRSKEPQEIEVSYLTSQITWKADYVSVLDQDDRSMDLSGWVTLDNQSGATYHHASLKLVAGDVHRALRPEPQPRYGRAVMMAEAAPAFEESAFFEYHIYDLNRKTTLKDRQSKQIRLLEADGVSVRKEYIADSRRNGIYPMRNPGDEKKVPVDVKIIVKNEINEGLGMPLPAGIVRFYKRDAKGSLQFVGEDRIEHTPKSEEVRLTLGRAFDIVVERIQTDYQQLSSKLFEAEWEIKIRNHKKEPADVTVLEGLSGNWEILRESQPYEKVDASTIRFKVGVPPGGEGDVRYRVRTGV